MNDHFVADDDRLDEKEKLEEEEVRLADLRIKAERKSNKPLDEAVGNVGNGDNDDVAGGNDNSDDNNDKVGVNVTINLSLLIFLPGN